MHGLESDAIVKLSTQIQIMLAENTFLFLCESQPVSGDQIFSIIQEGLHWCIVSASVTKAFLLKIFCTSLNCVAYH